MTPGTAAEKPYVDPGLAAILAAKDRRAERITELLRGHRRPVLSFTVVMPGPDKTGPRSLRIHEAGLAALRSALAAAGIPVLDERIETSLLGPEAFFSLGAPAEAVKLLALGIEETHPWGRLFDLDVLDERGERLSRTAFGRPERACLLCGGPAAVCYRERRHSAEELLEAVSEILRKN